MLAKKLDVKIESEKDIILVDDDSDQVHIVRHCCKMANLTNPVKAFDNGEKFLSYMNEVVIGIKPMPELIFLDINMPGLTGHEVLEKLRKIDKFKKVPVVLMLSGSNLDSDRDRALSLGANGYLTKPDNIDGFIDILKSLH